jgi:hypothetical protein
VPTFEKAEVVFGIATGMWELEREDEEMEGYFVLFGT